MLFSLIFLWGCGLELNSRMELNKDFSGHRLMTCTVSSADLARYFSGSKKDLDKVIRDACPKALVYKQTTEKDDTVYTFRMDFSSLKDYRKKSRVPAEFCPGDQLQLCRFSVCKGTSLFRKFLHERSDVLALYSSL